MHSCLYFTHLCVQLSAGDSNFNNTLFQWFFGFFGTPCRAFALIPQGSTQQKPWRPCWCSRQKSLIKILLNWNTNMAAVTSCANALLIRKEEENSHLCAGMLMNMSSTVCPPKKYPYNNRILSIEGTFFGTHCIIASFSLSFVEKQYVLLF